MFKKEIYISRREKLRASVKSGLILFIGNEESPMNYADNTYHYRQDSSFLYFFGLNHAGFAAILDCESGEDTVYGDDLTIDHFVWMGPQSTVKEQAASVGVSKTATLLQLEATLKDAVQRGRKIHFLPPYRADHKIMLFNWLGVNPNKTTENSSTELIYAVANLRNYKSAEELVEINKAVTTSVEMHKLAMRLAKPGVSEAKIAAAVEEVALAQNGHLSFPVIATINGQTLHNHYHGNTLRDGDLFLIDAGAETSTGYAGDLSSTVPVSGKFTSLQADIYNLSLASHNKAIEMLKPGTSFKEVYYESARVIVDGMKGLGLMKGNTEDALISGAHAMFFPCGLGHMMGMDVHDMENLGEVIVGYNGEPKSTQFGLKSLRLGRTLEPGFVLTIEPGIYFIPELIDLWKGQNHNSEFLNFDKINTFRNFGGIRNEEDFLITETGSQVLGDTLKPKSIEDVTAEWAK